MRGSAASSASAQARVDGVQLAGIGVPGGQREQVGGVRAVQARGLHG